MLIGFQVGESPGLTVSQTGESQGIFHESLYIVIFIRSEILLSLFWSYITSILLSDSKSKINRMQPIKVNIMEGIRYLHIMWFKCTYVYFIGQGSHFYENCSRITPHPTPLPFNIPIFSKPFHWSVEPFSFYYFNRHAHSIISFPELSQGHILLKSGM